MISVIVPVYNVEAYLVRCMESLLAQSYENLEIILVDDGSTDGSPSICDSYAKSDQRIVVLHRNNSGASDSRNMALDSATGDFIAFVDSDDFVDINYFKILLSNALASGADIAVCGSRDYYDNDEVIAPINDFDNCTMSTEAALEAMMYQKRVDNGPVCKIFRKAVFDGTRFVHGSIATDLGTTYKLLGASRLVAVSSYNGYYYRQRRGSITNSAFSEERMIGLEFAREQLDYMRMNFPGIIRGGQSRLFMEAFYILDKIHSAQWSGENEKAQCFSEIRNCRAAVLLDTKAKLSVRLRALVSYLGPAVLVLTPRLKSAIMKLFSGRPPR